MSHFTSFETNIKEIVFDYPPTREEVEMLVAQGYRRYGKTWVKRDHKPTQRHKITQIKGMLEQSLAA